MRGRGTALVVAALVLLAGIAVADALRGSGGADGDAAPPTTEDASPLTARAEPDPRARLADAGLGGVLYATVAEDAGCAFQAIALPELAATRLLRAPACRFDLSPDGRRVAFGSPCPSERLFVAELGRGDLGVLAGCSPAWRPDGRLTYVRGGAVVAGPEPRCQGRACRATLVPARRISSELDGVFADDFAQGFTLRELGWFARARLVAVVALEPSRREVLAVFADGSLAAAPVLGTRSFVQLHVLPRRQRAAATSGSAIDFVRSDGAILRPAPGGGARAVAYAPDEGAYAVAGGRELCFFRVPQERIACMPLVVADLDWR